MYEYNRLNATAVAHIFNRAIGHKCEMSQSLHITNEEILEAKQEFKNFVRFYDKKNNLNPQQEIYKNFINTLLIMLDNYEFTKDKKESSDYITKNSEIMLIQIQ